MIGHRTVALILKKVKKNQARLYLEIQPEKGMMPVYEHRYKRVIFAEARDGDRTGHHQFPAEIGGMSKLKFQMSKLGILPIL
jgi:hypothetical protein